MCEVPPLGFQGVLISIFFDPIIAFGVPTWMDISASKNLLSNIPIPPKFSQCNNNHFIFDNKHSFLYLYLRS